MICILVRDFAATKERQHTPHLISHIPLILIESGKYRPKVIAPDADAQQVGVKAKMWVGEARSLCPEADFLPVDEARYQHIFMNITRKLLAITDRIEPEYQATSAAWYSDDDLMLPQLIAAIEQLSGIVPQVGRASCKFPARVAAAMAEHGLRYDIAVGDEKVFLSQYSVNLLPLDKAMKRRLPLLGIQTLGQLAALPRIAIWEQFGKHGRWLHELASGIDMRPLTSFKAPVILSETQALEDPVEDREMLHRLLEQMSLRLVEHLRGREAHKLSLIVTCKDGVILDHHRHPNRPVKDHLYLLRLLTQMLDGLPIDTPIIELDVHLSDIRERMPVQLSLFETRKTVMSLQDVAPEWAGRYRQAAFYHLHLSDEAFLPEEGIERQIVSGA